MANVNALPKSEPHCSDVYQIIWDVISDKTSIEDCILKLKGVHNEPEVITDIITLIDMELQSFDNKGKMKTLYNLVAALNDKIISSATLKSHLELNILESASIIPSVKLYQQKYVKMKTKLFYKQQKFNLVREETEGYAKLIAQLMDDYELSNVTPHKMNAIICQLIGYFNLDPCRVLDVILEVFALRTNDKGLVSFFCQLISLYWNESYVISQLLGFRFTTYSNKTLPLPQPIYDMTALLVQANIIQISDLYPHLSPADEVLKLEAKLKGEEIRNYVKKLTGTKLKDIEEREDANTLTDLESTDLVAMSPPLRENNQKLEFCKALLKYGDWSHFWYLVKEHPAHEYLLMDDHITLAVCRLLSYILQPLYLKSVKKLLNVLNPRLIGDIPAPNPTPYRLEPLTDINQMGGVALDMLIFLGPKISRDILLLNKVLRICESYLQTNASKLTNITYCENDKVYGEIVQILKHNAFPTLSISSQNCCLSESIGRLTKYIHYQHRFNLYYHWKSAYTTRQHNDAYFIRHSNVIISKIKTTIKTKYIMRRLTKDNVKQIGRQVGKLSHSNPGVLFEHVLTQIQYYENLISPVIDTLRYITSLSFDVLMYCIIEALVNPVKSRTKYEDNTISVWFLNLANFAGAVCKKYCTLDLTGTLQYIANQLKQGRGLDLLILREIIHKMSGIEINDHLTPDQIDALSGGETLKSEAGYFVQIRNMKRSSQRLKESLLNSDLLISMAILIAQQRDCEIYKSSSSGPDAPDHHEEHHIKLLGKLYDQAQDAMVQYGTFVSTNFGIDEYIHLLPSLPQLINDYHVSFDAAFFIRRHSLSLTLKGTKYCDVLRQVLADEADQVKELMPAKTWEDLSPLFFVTFWTFSRYDIYFPLDSYAKEIAKLKQSMITIDETSKDGSAKRKKEKEKINLLVEKLEEEKGTQLEHVKTINEVFDQLKGDWFNLKTLRSDIITQFLQKCIFPRATFSVPDAIYCAEFIKLMHQLKTPNFSTLICFDRIFCDITYIMISLTENEASRYGVFLNCLMETALRWQSSVDIYKKECLPYPGFKSVIINPAPESKNNPYKDYLDYENFRHVCHKWHFKMTKAIVLCLESGNYVLIRNALIVLTKLLPNYPVVVNMGLALERRIEKIKSEEKDKRHDLYAIAVSYSGYLKQKKSKFIQDKDFHLKEWAPQQDKSKTAPPPSTQPNDRGKGSATQGALNNSSDAPKEKTSSKGKSPQSRSSPPTLSSGESVGLAAPLAELIPNSLSKSDLQLGVGGGDNKVDQAIGNATSAATAGPAPPNRSTEQTEGAKNDHSPSDAVEKSCEYPQQQTSPPAARSPNSTKNGVPISPLPPNGIATRSPPSYSQAAGSSMRHHEGERHHHSREDESLISQRNSLLQAINNESIDAKQHKPNRDSPKRKRMSSSPTGLSGRENPKEGNTSPSSPTPKKKSHRSSESSSQKRPKSVLRHHGILQALASTKKLKEKRIKKDKESGGERGQSLQLLNDSNDMLGTGLQSSSNTATRQSVSSQHSREGRRNHRSGSSRQHKHNHHHHKQRHHRHSREAQPVLDPFKMAKRESEGAGTEVRDSKALSSTTMATPKTSSTIISLRKRPANLDSIAMASAAKFLLKRSAAAAHRSGAHNLLGAGVTTPGWDHRGGTDVLTEPPSSSSSRVKKKVRRKNDKRHDRGPDDIDNQLMDVSSKRREIMISPSGDYYDELQAHQYSEQQQASIKERREQALHSTDHHRLYYGQGSPPEQAAMLSSSSRSRAGCRRSQQAQPEAQHQQSAPRHLSANNGRHPGMGEEMGYEKMGEPSARYHHPSTGSRIIKNLMHGSSEHSGVEGSGGRHRLKPAPLGGCDGLERVRSRSKGQQQHHHHSSSSLNSGFYSGGSGGAGDHNTF